MAAYQGKPRALCNMATRYAAGIAVKCDIAFVSQGTEPGLERAISPSRVKRNRQGAHPRAAQYFAKAAKAGNAVAIDWLKKQRSLERQ